MPIYEYQCDACGHKLEKLQKMFDDPLKDCPVCEKTTLSKLVSAAAFRLKGNGWYETDFKTGDKKNALHRSDSSGGNKESSSKSSSDSKPSAGSSNSANTASKSSGGSKSD